MPKGRLTAAQRGRVARRANGLCEYCKCPQGFCPDAFSIDHIQPRSRRGSDALANLAFVCQGCNNSKYNRTSARDPATGASTRFFNPRVDRWSEHFKWDESFAQIVGTTAIGRATIDLLKLNRPQVQNLRKLLHDAGLHPPAQ
ncbi:MAG TPA: HNH endonuclease signature motif containing protein [Tepidisphaeraceae bacterium]|nr:HNH endonuclease signature motif containing protein [Tepidisphaeraceae bacterium]